MQAPSTARMRGRGDGQQQGVLRDPTGQRTWTLSLVTHSCRPGLWPIPQGADTHPLPESWEGRPIRVVRGMTLGPRDPDSNCSSAADSPSYWEVPSP